MNIFDKAKGAIGAAVGVASSVNTGSVIKAASGIVETIGDITSGIDRKAVLNSINIIRHSLNHMENARDNPQVIMEESRRIHFEIAVIEEMVRNS